MYEEGCLYRIKLSGWRIRHDEDVTKKSNMKSSEMHEVASIACPEVMVDRWEF